MEIFRGTPSHGPTGGTPSHGPTGGTPSHGTLMEGGRQGGREAGRQGGREGGRVAYLASGGSASMDPVTGMSYPPDSSGSSRAMEVSGTGAHAVQ